MLEQRFDPEGGHDSDGGLFWSDPWLRGLQPVKGNHSNWRNLWRTVSCGKDAMLPQETAVRSYPPEEEEAAETMVRYSLQTPFLALLHS